MEKDTQDKMSITLEEIYEIKIPVGTPMRIISGDSNKAGDEFLGYYCGDRWCQIKNDREFLYISPSRKDAEARWNMKPIPLDEIIQIDCIRGIKTRGIFTEMGLGYMLGKSFTKSESEKIRNQIQL